MKQTALAVPLFFGVALLSLVVALLPLLKGDRMNGVFLGVAVVFFALGVAIKRKTAGRS
ncbi:MAG TPA: hypothetical protein VFV54_08250 [Thermoanaerobaculia bacterium]|nr:hypothetical protein [Thermoanaerobaculia bacterium]